MKIISNWMYNRKVEFFCLFIFYLIAVIIALLSGLLNKGEYWNNEDVIEATIMIYAIFGVIMLPASFVSTLSFESTPLVVPLLLGYWPILIILIILYLITQKKWYLLPIALMMFLPVFNVVKIFLDSMSV